MLCWFVLFHGFELCALSWLIDFVWTSIYGVYHSVFCSCPTVVATLVTSPDPWHLKENYNQSFGWVCQRTPIPKTKHFEGIFYLKQSVSLRWYQLERLRAIAETGRSSVCGWTERKFDGPVTSKPAGWQGHVRLSWLVFSELCKTIRLDRTLPILLK